MQEITRSYNDGHTIRDTLVGQLSPALMKVFSDRREEAEQESLQGVKIEIKETRNIGRNDPCPCGSTKKFKKCCGRNISITDDRIK